MIIIFKTQRLAVNGINLLPLKTKEFKLDQATSNTFNTNVTDRIKEIEERFGGKNNANNLASGIGNLIVKQNSPEEDRKKAASLYKNNVPKSLGNNVNENNIYLKTNPSTGEDYTYICDYYEYIQFKRAHFDCSKSDQVVYNQNTGRITSMTFEFNGKFE